MAGLQETVEAQVAAGLVPGAVAVFAVGAEVTVASAGPRVSGVAGGDGSPMARDRIFRVASAAKPVLAAATMVLADRGRFGLDDPVAAWLPELADPVVLRRPDGPLDDVVPAVRPITVRHLLTLQAGHGFPGDFSHPIVAHLLGDLHQGPPRPQELPPPDEWMARLARLPLLHQPGEGWTYNTGYDALGVLLSRREGAPLGEVLEDTILGPVGMVDTGFAVPEDAVDRMTSHHERDPVTGAFGLLDAPDGQWATMPEFPSGAGGLVSTADDLLRFFRMLLADGAIRGRRVLSAEAVRTMTAVQAEAEPGNLFLEGHGWGFGGSIDLAATDPWNVPGRYGWVGGTGTAAYIFPSADTTVVWLSQVELHGPDDSRPIAAVLTWAAEQVRGATR